MLFRLNINLNEDDYFAFNSFHAFESMHGKKMVNKARALFILAMVILSAFVLLVMGFRTFSVIYVTLVLLVTLLYMVFYKKLLHRNMKAQIKQLKKIGKLPFDPISTLEFYEDKMVEITASSRAEEGYNIFERLCVVKDRYIFLYRSSVSAYILPVAQVEAQLNQEKFVEFLSEKCAKVEYY